MDYENSVHRVAYQAQLDRLNAGGSVSRMKPGPEVVYAVLRHALLSSRPRPHYVVTWPAKIGALMKRLLPAAMLLPHSCGALLSSIDRTKPMATVFNILAILVMVAVVVVLIRGLANMLRGGSGNTSNKLMQARVLLQFIALRLILLGAYFAGRF